MAPDLNQMLIFAGVVEAGGFTAASKALGMPKSTVSKRVGELEDRLGVRLLHRTTRHVKLTAAGASYYAQCRRVVADAASADRAASAGDRAPRGLVRVTAPRLLERTFARAFERFLKENEGVSLELLITNRVVDLVKEGVDLAIRPGALPDSSLVARHLGDVEHCVCASPDYLAGRPPIARPRDLRGHACVTFLGRGGRQLWSFEREGKRSSVLVGGRYSVSSVGLVRRGALAGLGVVSVPAFVVERDVAAGRLVRLLEGWSTGRGALRAVYPSGRHLSPAVRALLDLLVATFAEGAPWAKRARAGGPGPTPTGRGPG